MSKRVFVIYPSKPAQLRDAISGAIEKLEEKASNITPQSWEQIDAPGRFIVEGILQRIDESEFVVADITRLNFNVTFEVGYAIGRSKRVVLTINEGLSPGTREITQLGIYDTLGYSKYQNASGLARIIESIEERQVSLE